MSSEFNNSNIITEEQEITKKNEDNIEQKKENEGLQEANTENPTENDENKIESNSNENLSEENKKEEDIHSQQSYSSESESSYDSDSDESDSDLESTSSSSTKKTEVNESKTKDNENIDNENKDIESKDIESKDNENKDIENKDNEIDKNEKIENNGDNDNENLSKSNLNEEDKSNNNSESKEISDENNKENNEKGENIDNENNNNESNEQKEKNEEEASKDTENKDNNNDETNEKKEHHHHHRHHKKGDKFNVKKSKKKHRSKHGSQRLKLLEKEKENIDNAPKSYTSNTEKENMILKYVSNFNRQYSQQFPNRKKLMLCPENEYGIKKFVCTTIRPTQLPFNEIYDYNACALFVANYIKYEPLEPSHELPLVLASPTFTLEKQVGNCYECSTLLVSLLRGVGYDAYIVSGYATIDVTLLDESKVYFEPPQSYIKHDDLPKPLKITKSNVDGEEVFNPINVADSFKVLNENNENEKESKYKIKPSKKFESNFLRLQAEKKKYQAQLELEKKQLEEEELQRKKDEEENYDFLRGMRVHAWVLVLPGKREISEAFFIEPSTGKITDINDSKYLGIESVWSSQNYWANMQPCFNGLSGISFDLSDNLKWEYLLLSNSQPSYSFDKQDDKPDDQGSDDEENEELNSNILDLPRSWVDQLVISKENFESVTPSGKKIIIYSNAKYEIYADYFRKDGLVKRIIYFADDKFNFKGKIHEFYLNRSDKLVERVIISNDDTIIEYFLPGRSHGLKKHIIVGDRTKEMHFYPEARNDGLYKRVDLPNKVIEYFQERDDRLNYRSVTFDSSKDSDILEQRVIVKMAEKYDRNPEVPAHKDAAKKTYFVKKEKIKVVFHREKDRIIQSWREFKKPISEQKENINELITEFQINPFLKQPKKQYLYDELCKLITSEQLCLQAIKSSAREIKEILQVRDQEENEIVLQISIYDTIRNKTIQIKSDNDPHKNDDDNKLADLDYLSPFIIKYANGDGSDLTKEEAQQIRDACLATFKQRLIDKGNIIQTRLDYTTKEYQRRQLEYSKNADTLTKEETESYVAYSNEALFKIHVLEKCLAKQKEVASTKLTNLNTKLRNDERLKCLYE
ncbi:hypothetical protein LY90DRAFT_667193 [Neocallimastix californiae]|jgi:hypothetical protein|uniref:Dynein regulatory complex subunit 7 n=1 Tax=Neocallimastix californiae TaxID=1754190 RepID=A0A1Y2EL99_9FUNG|nr:hypothetical protein LY90DRAFT_667193 [Neocallimastix californiae]|eukprot:ORY72319.1 hypothetical protein LY90DRAFT_667193 [Neocallimastix californiae]